LARPLTNGLDAIRRQDVRALGEALNNYADVLADSGLEMRRTFEDRRALAKLPASVG